MPEEVDHEGRREKAVCAARRSIADRAIDDAQEEEGDRPGHDREMDGAD
jgi:hypothetical protein